MKLQRFEVSKTPHLTIACQSSLEISGGREGEVAIKVYGDEKDLEVSREGERLTIEARARCKIGCPSGTTVTLQAVQGDLRVRRVDGPIAAEAVRGDVVLKDVGPTTITTSAGDVRVRSVRGDLRLDEVSGDLLVRDVDGMLTSDKIGGDLRATHLEGGLRVTVGGDCSLTTDFSPVCDYQLTAGGDAALKFPDQANVRVQVQAGGGVHHKVDWAEVQEGDGTLSGRVGGGEANLEINAKGDVSLRGKADSGRFVFNLHIDDDLDLELESMAEDIERNIEAHMALMNAQLDAKLSHIDHDAIRRKAEKAAEKVRRRAEHAAERARLKAERAQRRWQRMSAPPSAPSAPSPGQPAAAAITEEERMRVLRMVQEGKITASEAAQLLEAMEG